MRKAAATQRGRCSLEEQMELSGMNSRPVEALGPHETRVLYQAVGFFFHLV